MYELKKCSNCSHYKQGLCKIKKFKVSVNANWCNDYKASILSRITKLFK